MKIGKARVGGRGANNRSIALVVAGLTIGRGILIGATACADDSVGSVTEITGDAQIERGGAKLPVDEGMVVKVHDKLTTQPGTSLTLGFGDGGSIALSANTSIAIEDSTTTNGQTLPSRVTLIRGVHSHDRARPDHRSSAKYRSGYAEHEGNPARRRIAASRRSESAHSVAVRIDQQFDLNELFG